MYSPTNSFLQLEDVSKASPLRVRESLASVCFSLCTYYCVPIILAIMHLTSRSLYHLTSMLGVLQIVLHNEALLLSRLLCKIIVILKCIFLTDRLVPRLLSKLPAPHLLLPCTCWWVWQVKSTFLLPKTFKCYTHVSGLTCKSLGEELFSNSPVAPNRWPIHAELA